MKNGNRKPMPSQDFLRKEFPLVRESQEALVEDYKAHPEMQQPEYLDAYISLQLAMGNYLNEDWFILPCSDRRCDNYAAMVWSSRSMGFGMKQRRFQESSARGSS